MASQPGAPDGYAHTMSRPLAPPTSTQGHWGQRRKEAPPREHLCPRTQGVLSRAFPEVTQGRALHFVGRQSS